MARDQERPIGWGAEGVKTPEQAGRGSDRVGLGSLRGC